MPRLRRLSGDQVVTILGRHEFVIASQRGSHAKLARVTETGHRQTLTVPIHKELDVGTCQALFRQACRFIPADDLYPDFYSD